MFETTWTRVPGLVNTLDNEGEMDAMLANTDDSVHYTSVLVPTLTWDGRTDREILTAEGGTWVEGGAGLMSREGRTQ